MPLTDVDVIGLTVWAEARGEPVEGKIAVASVIRNRLNLGRWGDTYVSVCCAPKQFSCWNAGNDPNHKQLMALVAQVLTGQMPADPVLAECYWIAWGCQSKAMRDNVSGATHYHVATMQPRPAWAIDQTPVAQRGSHMFYRGIQ